MSEKLSLPSIKDLLEGGPGLIDYSSSSRNQQHQKQKSYLHRHRRHASEHITSSTNYSRHNILPPPPPIPSITASSTTNRTNYTPLTTSTTTFINNDDTNISKQSTISSITAPSSTQQDTIRFSLPHEMQQLSLEKSPKEIMSLKNLLPSSSRNRTHSRSYSDFTHNYASSITIRPFPSKLSTMNESRSSSTANTLPVLLPNPNTTTSATEDKEEKVAISSDNQESTTHARYVCPYCKKGFTRPSSLRTHTYSHTGEKPFVCTEPCCGKKFSVQSNLRRHLRIHRLNKPTTLFLPKNIN